MRDPVCTEGRGGGFYYQAVPEVKATSVARQSASGGLQRTFNCSPELLLAAAVSVEEGHVELRSKGAQKRVSEARNPQGREMGRGRRVGVVFAHRKIRIAAAESGGRQGWCERPGGARGLLRGAKEGGEEGFK